MKKCQIYWLTVLFFLAPFFVLAQNEEEEIGTFKRAVKVPLFDMIDPFGPVFGLGVEQKIGHRKTLYFEGGYLTTFDGQYMLRRDLEGYKLRGEFRFYDRDDFSLEGVSFGLQIMYKSDSANENGDFERGGGNYFQNLDYQIKREAVALHFMTNVMFPLSGNSFVEIGAWAGARRLIRTHEGVPDDAELFRDFGFFVSRDPGTFFLPSLGFSLRIGLGW